MRTPIAAALLLMLAGCASSKPAAGSGAAESACILQSGGHNILRLTLTTGSTCTSRDGTVHLHSPDGDFDVWLVRGVTTIDDGVKRIEGQIGFEFKNFRANSTTAIDIAGAPAKRLSGYGVEADDGDPGTADVIVFKTGDNIFIACTHAEVIPASAQRWMTQVISTARVP